MENKNSDCLFCKIITGDIPCAKIFEDEKILAFMDIFPAAKGHTLIVPKKHSTNLVDMDKEDMFACLGTVQKLAPKIIEAMGAQGFNLGMNNFKAAGQVVMHSHFHIIPRKPGDGLKMWEQGKYEEGEMKVFADRITKALDQV
ncbi:MAG: HIT family protein [Nanoarchaeota archaeon]|nr:HIT family protein [Nanoarchaeota archaeon]